MSIRLSSRIYPFRLARTGETLRGKIPLAQLGRLTGAQGTDRVVNNEQGVAEFTLVFERDEEGRHLISGSVNADLELLCQRCLEPMSVACAADIRLAPCKSEADAQYLQPGFEPLLVDEFETVSLASIIEDELILEMPAIPCHPGGKCRMPEHGGEGADAGGESPFAVLAKAKLRR